MKKALIWLFNDFKFTRERSGGTWYQVQVANSGSGMAGSIKYWTQNKPEDEEDEIIKTEKW